jgi:hypothetical protein
MDGKISTHQYIRSTVTLSTPHTWSYLTNYHLNLVDKRSKKKKKINGDVRNPKNPAKPFP